MEKSNPKYIIRNKTIMLMFSMFFLMVLCFSMVDQVNALDVITYSDDDEDDDESIEEDFTNDNPLDEGIGDDGSDEEYIDDDTDDDSSDDNSTNIEDTEDNSEHEYSLDYYDGEDISFDYFDFAGEEDYDDLDGNSEDLSPTNNEEDSYADDLSPNNEPEPNEIVAKAYESSYGSKMKNTGIPIVLSILSLITLFSLTAFKREV